MRYPEAALPDLVKKYDRPGPRYTSYPTAVEFTDEFTATDYRAALATASRDTERPLGIYIHVPFCERRCTYCGCHVIPTEHHEVSRAYLENLVREIDLVAAELRGGRNVKVIHLGGGTPTYLEPGELESLTEHLFKRFDLADSPEISIEVDPRVTTPTHLELLRRSGFNRLSLGVQDFSEDVQEAIGRGQTLEQTEQAYSIGRSLGFAAINFDLVYGLPLQTKESLAETIARVIAMRPDRIAMYGYAHLPSVRPNQASIDASTLPTGLDKLRLYLQAEDDLTAAGYRPIGMDHFALASDELAIASAAGRLSRNFMGYTPHDDLEIIGLGISSIGDIGSAYIQNEKRLAPYYRALTAGEFPVERGRAYSRDDAIRRWVIHQLMCNFRLDPRQFETRYGERFGELFRQEVGELRAFVDDGLVDVDGDCFVVNPVGRLFVRNVAMIFDRYSRQQPTTRFSRTV